MSQSIRKKARTVAEPINDLINKPFLNEMEVAALTGRAVSSLRNDRHMRRNLPFYKCGTSGRSVRYKTDEVIQWLTARRITFNEVSE